jgi:hypothetical protein
MATVKRPKPAAAKDLPAKKTAVITGGCTKMGDKWL